MEFGSQDVQWMSVGGGSQAVVGSGPVCLGAASLGRFGVEGLEVLARVGFVILGARGAGVRALEFM